MNVKALVVARVIGASLAALPICICAHAGEIGTGLSSCKINDILLGCKWKPTNCYRPSPPIFFSYGKDGYNSSVDAYNIYVHHMQEYEDCIIAEGKRDITDNFPDLVAKSAKKEIEDANREVSRARSQLELMR